MPPQTLSSFSDPLLDTPPLSPSRPPSSASATRSSVGSSNESVSLGDLGNRMSRTRIDRHISCQSTEGVDPQGTSRKYAADSTMLNGAREDDIEEESDVDMEQGVYSQDRGRSGYEECHDLHQDVSRSRPSMPRQGSYSKRHSSFDTPREVPFPYGYLASANSTSNLPISSRERLHERFGSLPETYQDQLVQHSGSSKDTEGNHGVLEPTNESSNDSSLSRRPTLERSSSTSLPLPSFLPYSSLPPMIPPGSPPQSGKIGSPSMVRRSSSKRTDSDIQSPMASPQRTTPLKPPTEQKPSPRSPQTTRLPREPPSPPLLTDEPDAPGLTAFPDFQFSYLHSPHDSRSHSSLPPPPKFSSLSLASPASQRPISFPHRADSRSFASHSPAGTPPIPPPQPPTVLTPPPPMSATDEGSHKPAHEPFLSHDQPSPNHTYIAVETTSSEYKLVVRLPGFQRDSITLAMRRRRILHVVADNWSDDGGHFERRISFGYDADLANVRAEFDGEILRIFVPRRTPPGWYAHPTN